MSGVQISDSRELFFSLVGQNLYINIYIKKLLSVIWGGIKQGTDTDRLRGLTMKRWELHCCHGDPEFDFSAGNAKTNKNETLKGRLSHTDSD